MPVDRHFAFAGRTPPAAGPIGPPDWMRPLLLTFLLLVIVHSTATISLRPFVLAATAGNAAIADLISRSLWVTLVFAPILAAAKAVIFAIIAWSIAALVGREASGPALFSVFLTGEVIVALTGIFVSAVLWVRGAGNVHSPTDLRVAQGIDLFLDMSSSTVAMSIAESATIFHLMWWVFLIVALRRATGLSRGWAVLSATAVWGLTLAVAVVRGRALA